MTRSAHDLPRPPADRSGWPWFGGDVVAAPTGPVPSITIVTPSYNQATFLEATIRSVLLQGYPALQYVIVDGGSTDGSVDVIRKYEPWLASWVSERDGGQSAAINKGLTQATGDVVAWLNSDDRLLPGALAGVASAVARTPDAVAWVASTRTVDANGRLVYPRVAPHGLDRASLADWNRAGHVPQPSCFFSRRAAERVGLLDERYHFVMDVDLWLRLAGIGRLEAVDALWAEETQHARAKTVAQRGRLVAELHLLQIRSGFDTLAVERLAEELQELDMHRHASPARRLKHEVDLLLHPVRALLRSRFGGRGTR